MQTRRFGRTELQMPVFSCGGMRFQQSWSDRGQPIEPQSQANLLATVQRALELGVNHLETARGYGTSERQIGMLWDDVDRDEVILQTKVGPTEDPADFEAHVRESLARLQVDRVDLFALHGVNTWEKLWWSLRPGGCLEVARRLQAEGMLGHVGLSTHGGLPLIMQAIDAGFDYINLHWYLIFDRNWPAIEAAAAADMGVFIISPSDKGGRLYEPSPRLVELCEPIHPLVLNARYCLNRPEVHTLSIGASNPADFDLALTAADLAPESIDVPLGRLRTVMDDTLGPGVWASLTDGLPAWDHTPGLINAELTLILWAVARAWGMADFARWRYAHLGKESDWVPGMDAREAGNLNLGRAFKDSPHSEQIGQWLMDAHRLLAPTKGD